MKIYLVGYMGSGKSTLGCDLAKATGFSWVDLDTEFELKYKISIPDFFAKYGEPAFRELEHKLLKDISLMSKIIVSTGGGTPCFFGSMDFMNQNGLTIYLEATPDLLLSRIKPLSRKRPLFQQMKGKHSLQNLSQHLESRLVFYKQAKITIDAAKPDIAEVKNLILNYTGTISVL
ncbi:MAG: shikimate kinase [Bacteroidota bacterium]